MSYMSQEGYDKLRAQIKQLEEVERPEVIRQIQEMQNTTQQKRHRENWRPKSRNSKPLLQALKSST